MQALLLPPNVIESYLPVSKRQSGERQAYTPATRKNDCQCKRAATARPLVYQPLLVAIK